MTTSTAPFRRGTILALAGSGIANGCHVFVCDCDAVEHQGEWRLGSQFGRHWGTHDGLTVRYATHADIDRLMKLEADAMLRVCDSIARLRCLEKAIKDQQSPS